MAEKKDKAFEGAEVKEEVVAPVEEAPKAEKKVEKKVEKKDKALDKNAIKVGDYVVYEAAHGKRRVKVLEEDELTVTIVGDDGAKIRISKEKVKKD